jgi:hypothetical protein
MTSRCSTRSLAAGFEYSFHASCQDEEQWDSLGQEPWLPQLAVDRLGLEPSRPVTRAMQLTVLVCLRVIMYHDFEISIQPNLFFCIEFEQLCFCILL